ncbi:type II CAAX prenyl endopeptidase Rce1 family protein [Micromonospora sp.]|uniref:CPBP family glutamic-type intramembrane protease n=1 Tax=Micromonospora sp. TaxID=1876 RepID=UPI003B3AA3BC
MFDTVMRQLRRTPSALSGLDEDDRTGPSLSPWLALTIVLGAYLAFFGRGVIRAIQILGTGQMPADDYASASFVAQVPLWIGEIVVAGVLLYLVARLWSISRPMTGIPARGANPVPSLLAMYAAVYGLGIAGAVKTGIDGGFTDHGGTVDNAWAFLGVLRSLNAGVVEEIVIVALLLLLRRAGWPLPAIFALSVLMRWPFHLYHGWASAPWALIWGGTFFLTFVYLRRLAPLIIVHTLMDTTIVLSQAYNAWGVLVAAVLWFTWLGFLLYRIAQTRVSSLNNPQRPTASQLLSIGFQNGGLALGFVGLIGAGVCTAAAIELTGYLDQPEALTYLVAFATAAVAILALLVVLPWVIARNTAVTTDPSLRIDDSKPCLVAWRSGSRGRVTIAVARNADPARTLAAIRALEPQATGVGYGGALSRRTAKTWAAAAAELSAPESAR